MPIFENGKRKSAIHSAGYITNLCQLLVTQMAIDTDFCSLKFVVLQVSHCRRNFFFNYHSWSKSVKSVVLKVGHMPPSPRRHTIF